MKEHIEQLKHMRAELLQRVSAIDAAISALSELASEMTTDEDFNATEETKNDKTTGETYFKSSIDLSQIPDYNPGAGGIRD